MTTIQQQPAAIDQDKLMAFVFQAVAEAGAPDRAAALATATAPGQHPRCAGRRRRARSASSTRMPASS